jgi:hypothetical protein
MDTSSCIVTPPQAKYVWFGLVYFLLFNPRNELNQNPFFFSFLFFLFCLSSVAFYSMGKVYEEGIMFPWFV